jgi:predicted RNase H-like nuclease
MRRTRSRSRAVERGLTTLGIDLAAQAKETAACVIRWATGEATVDGLAAGLDDQALLTTIERHKPVKIAIDAPFGWPQPFVAALTEYSTGGRWPEEETLGLRLRLTDRVVIAETRQQPLSVSSDRIAVTAMRCARLLTRLRDLGLDVTRDGSGAVAEVYPASALRQWGLDPRGYKGSKPEQSAKRGQLVIKLTAEWPWLRLNDGVRRSLESSDHLFDALVCAVLARVVLSGESLPIPEARGLAKAEGWIHLPKSSLSEVRSRIWLGGHTRS